MRLIAGRTLPALPLQALPLEALPLNPTAVHPVHHAHQTEDVPAHRLYRILEIIFANGTVIALQLREPALLLVDYPAQAGDFLTEGGDADGKADWVGEEVPLCEGDRAAEFFGEAVWVDLRLERLLLGGRALQREAL